MQGLEKPRDVVCRSCGELSRWLLDVAYPLWARRGFDELHGGFHETLDAQARPLYEPRRIRVQLRQVYCFARAPALGWTGEVEPLVAGGLAYVKSYYRRPDGLYRTLVAPDGTALDDRAFLYDQAFVLLALAESQRVLGPRADLIAAALELKEALYTHLKKSDAGFLSAVADPFPILANPHMHLLEAALAWAEISDDPAWRALSDEIALLALGRFVDTRTGAIREQFASDWRPLGPEVGPVVEPGHLFEWAWLLLRWGRAAPRAAAVALECAERLVEIGETYGVHGGVAVAALLDDFTVSDGSARLWSQTERLKASIYLAGRASVVAEARRARYWETAARAVAGFSKFLNTRTPGLWDDTLAPGGRFVPSRVPASTFYHIVSAIAELSLVCNSAI